MVLVGPSDLSINIDCPVDYTNPKYIEALQKISSACKRAGVVFGMYFQPPGLPPQKLIEMGCRFFTVPWQVNLRASFRSLSRIVFWTGYWTGYSH